MKIKIEGKEAELNFSGTAGGLLRLMKLSRESHIVKLNGRIVPDGEKISEGDSVELLRVIYGG